MMPKVKSVFGGNSRQRLVQDETGTRTLQIGDDEHVLLYAALVSDGIVVRVNIDVKGATHDMRIVLLKAIEDALMRTYEEEEDRPLDA